MKAFLFEHRVVEGHWCLTSAENLSPLPDKYWKYLGMVNVTTSWLKEPLRNQKEPLEITEDIFEWAPEVNQLIS